jgi:hypothetical protein
MKANRVNPWYYAFAQPATFLGAIAIIIILGGAFFLEKEEYSRAYKDGIQRGADLTRVLEENISRIFYNTNYQLLLLRQLYQRNGKDPDLAHWTNNSTLDNSPAVHFAIVGADGKILMSSLPSIPVATYVGDKDYFQIQLNAKMDDLFIGTPAVDGASKKMTVQLSRRLITSDGSFGGVILASLAVPRFDALYSSLDVDQMGLSARAAAIIAIPRRAIILAALFPTRSCLNYIANRLADTFGAFQMPFVSAMGFAGWYRTEP